MTPPTIRSIETFYNGITYRSKLEACWAAFFDLLHIRHDYELDAFELKCGNYTPDFWLPDVDKKLGMWVEIKGRTPSVKARQKCLELCYESGRKTAIFVGQPMRHVRAVIGEENVYLYDYTNEVLESVHPHLIHMLAPTVTVHILHHAGVQAHQAVRWSADINSKVNQANKAWTRRPR